MPLVSTTAPDCGCVADQPQRPARSHAAAARLGETRPTLGNMGISNLLIYYFANAAPRAMSPRINSTRKHIFTQLFGYSPAMEPV